MRLRSFALVMVTVLGGCGFLPEGTYPRLDEASAEAARARADPEVVRYAAAELRKAENAIDRAVTERDSLGDPAVIEHLAYVGRQRVAIARESARLAAARSAADPGRR